MDQIDPSASHGPNRPSGAEWDVRAKNDRHDCLFYVCVRMILTVAMPSSDASLSLLCKKKTLIFLCVAKKVSTHTRGKTGAEKLGRVTVTLPSFSAPVLPRICVDTFFWATKPCAIFGMPSRHVRMTFCSSTPAGVFSPPPYQAKADLARSIPGHHFS